MDRCNKRTINSFPPFRRWKKNPHTEQGRRHWMQHKKASSEFCGIICGINHENIDESMNIIMFSEVFGEISLCIQGEYQLFAKRTREKNIKIATFNYSHRICHVMCYNISQFYGEISVISVFLQRSCWCCRWKIRAMPFDSPQLLFWPLLLLFGKWNEMKRALKYAKYAQTSNEQYLKDAFTWTTRF